MPAALESVAQGHRELASAVKRLRVAVMTDPGRAGQLADALVGLVGNRLLAWSWAEAATEAPESVVQSARILAAGGPVGPYADLGDAVRYFTASVQLAMVQAGLGQVEAAGRTLDALDAWRGQLGRLPVVERLTPVTVVRALATRARAWLAQDVAQANSYADAALQQWYASRLDVEPSLAYLALTAHLAAADARWAAGRPEAALAHHRLAVARYRVLLDDLGDTPRPALAQLALAPLTELHQPYALRLEAIGDVASGLAVRREWLALLEQFTDPADPDGLTVARAALGRALARAGREREAAEFAASIAISPAEPSLPTVGNRTDWTELPGDRALAAGALTVTAIVRLRQDERTAMVEGAAARKEAEADEDRRRAAAEQAAMAAAAAMAEAERRASAEAEAVAREAADKERAEAEAAAARRAAQQEAERAAAEERRRELAAAHEQPRMVDAETVRRAQAELPHARETLLLVGDDPAGLAAAQEHLAELLRPLASADPAARYRDELVATLEALVGLRWRLGDADGSREAARELKSW